MEGGGESGPYKLLKAYKEQILLIGSINVHIGNKARRNELVGLLSWIGIDLCVVSETWFREDSGERLMNESLENSEYGWSGRDRQKQKTWTGDGGVGIVVKKGIGEVSVAKVSKEYDMLWLRIKMNEEILYVAAVYCCCEGSKRMSDTRAQFLELEADIFEFQKQGKVICLGDFNARIGVGESFYWRGEEKVVIPRMSEDHQVEGIDRDRGQQFLDIMNARDMIILNGVDNKGEFTFIEIISPINKRIKADVTRG